MAIEEAAKRLEQEILRAHAMTQKRAREIIKDEFGEELLVRGKRGPHSRLSPKLVSALRRRRGDRWVYHKPGSGGGGGSWCTYAHQLAQRVVGKARSEAVPRRQKWNYDAFIEAIRDDVGIIDSAQFKDFSSPENLGALLERFKDLIVQA